MTEQDYKNMTMGEWLDYWYNTYKKPKRKPTTIRNIEQMIRLHTPTWLKEKRLVDISIFDIDSALSTMTASRTAVYTRQTWHSAFFKAEQLGILPRNVVSLSEPITYKKKKSKSLSPKELETLFSTVKGKRIEWLFYFAVCSGARRGEIASLLWSDVDFENNTIHIKGTKTQSSDRYIPITDDIRYALEGQRSQIEKEKGTRFESKHPEKVFDYNANYLSHVFKNYSPSHHLHELRHTYITICAERNINVNVCQQLVGHSSPNVTLSIYTHVLDNFKRQETSKFSLFSKPK